MQIKNILFYPLLAAVCAVSSCGGVKKDPLQVAEVVRMMISMGEICMDANKYLHCSLSQ